MYSLEFLGTLDTVPSMKEMQMMLGGLDGTVHVQVATALLTLRVDYMVLDKSLLNVRTSAS